jgi:intracellular sulfur oxidation DsrE/DsrF family protein
VLAARASAHFGSLSALPLSALAQSGVTVLADDFSLQERGIAKLAEGVTAASIEVVVDHLAAGHRTLWH